LAIKFRFYRYFIIDQRLGPIEALKRSYEITAGSEWELFLFYLLIIGVNLLGALACGIGLLATVPASMVAEAFVYRKLLTAKETAPVG
jgi:uncharacterized membrane protein